MDIILYKYYIASTSGSVTPGNDFKYLIPAVSGLIGVVLGFILNRINDYYVKGRVDLNNFKQCLLNYSRGEIGFVDVLLLYSFLRKKDKKKVNMDELKLVGIDNKEEYCISLIKKL